MTRRLLPLLIQLVICIQAGFVAAIIPAAPIVPAVAAFAGACTVASGDAGGTVSACSNADTYAELVADLSGTFEDLRGESATQPLSVTSTPVGASVEINGLSAGLTPLNTSVQAGSYLIRVSKSGFESYSTSVAVGDGGASLNAALNPVDDTPIAVSELVQPATLIALAGAPADCDFEIGNFVKDKVGDYYISFSCFVQGSIPVDAPEEAPGFVQYTATFRPQLRTSGVARTTDNGRTWTLVDSWTDTFTVRAWTSPRFADAAPAAVSKFLHGEFAEVVRLGARTVAADPQYAAVYDLIGAAHLKLGQPGPARDAFQTSLRFNPHDSTAYTNLGILELEAGNGPDAARHFAEALWLDPESKTAREGLAQARR